MVNAHARTAFALAAFSLPQAAWAKSYKDVFPGTTYQVEQTQKLVQSFDYKQGRVVIDEAGIALNVPEEFYFFDAADARRVLVDIWGNPPAVATHTLGLILPANKTPVEDTWGAVISFDADGYVSDADAKSMDYTQLLASMKSSTADANEERVKTGYSSIRLVGWASPPFYDEASHKLHWAKELEFDGKPDHTLNYDVRALGRRGVLKINFIADMKQLDQIDRVIPVVMAMPEFERGFAYADYVPSTDKLATYGIGGLIAGKLAAKAGLFVLALAFLKKGFVLVLLALSGLWRGITWLFRGRPKSD